MGQEKDSKQSRERFELGLSWVKPIALRLRASLGLSTELEELIGWGQSGLLEASRRFDPERGIQFKGFASFRIRGAMLDGVRQHSYLPRRIHERVRAHQAATLYSEGAAEDAAGAAPETGAARDAALGAHLAGMATAMATGLVAESAYDEQGGSLAVAAEQRDPEQLSSQQQLLLRIREGISELPEPESTIVRRHYLQGEQFDAVARDLGLSRSWASRLHTRAIGRLSKRLNAPTPSPASASP